MWNQPPTDTGLDSPNPAKDLSTICHLCYIYTDNLNRLAMMEVGKGSSARQPLFASPAQMTASLSNSEIVPLLLSKMMQCNLPVL